MSESRIADIVLQPLVGVQNQGAPCKAYRVGVRFDEDNKRTRKVMELRIAATDSVDLQRQIHAIGRARRFKTVRVVALIEETATTLAVNQLIDAEHVRCKRKEPTTP